MTDLTEKQLSAILKPGVTLASIPVVLLRKIKRIPGLLQGTEETKKYLVESPPFTMAQCHFFRMCVDAMTSPKQRGYESFEEFGMSDPAGPKWAGTLCKAKEEVKEYVPVPHPPDVKQEDKADVWAATIASMMCTLSTTEDVEMNVSPSIASGPLSKLVTPLSLASYGLAVPELLQGKVGVDRQDEKFAEAVYVAVAKMKPTEKNQMVNATYALMSGLGIKVSDRGASSSKDFEMDWNRKPRNKFPLGVPKTIRTKISFVPRAVKVGKQTSTVVLNHYLQSFPPKLLQYFGFFGNPSKTQRMFMRMRPYLDIAMPLDPKDSLKKWLEAGQYAYYDSTDLEVPQSDKISLVKKDYNGNTRPAGKALYLGQVEFDSNFFSQNTIVMYHPPHKNHFFYIPNKHAKVLAQLPDVYCTFPKKIITSDVFFTQALNGFSSILCTCFMRGTYNPRPQQYETLDYPLPKAGEYMTLDPHALGDDVPHQVLEADRVDTDNVDSFVFGDYEDEYENAGEENVPEEEQSKDDEEDIEEEDFSGAPSLNGPPTYVPIEDYEEAIRPSDRRLEVADSFPILWEGDKYVVCGVCRVDGEIISVKIVPAPKPVMKKVVKSSKSSVSSEVAPIPKSKVREIGDSVRTKKEISRRISSQEDAQDQPQEFQEYF